MAQLYDVHSVLRLNYETLRGLISSASLRVAKPTGFETPVSRRTSGPLSGNYATLIN